MHNQYKMRKMAPPEYQILNLDIDLVIIIFSLLLNDNFIDFANFFQIWVFYQTPKHISIILQHIDWSNIHIHESSLNPIAQHKFSAFLEDCKTRGINHALCYDACKHLLQRKDPENNLYILRQLSHNHFLSFLAFHVFSSIYNGACVEESATSIYHRLKNFQFKSNLQSMVITLQKYTRQHNRGSWNAVRPFTPLPLWCPLGKERISTHFYFHGWPPTFEEIINSTCPLCCLQMICYEIFEEYLYWF